MTNPKWKLLFEVGALCGHPDPARLADYLLAPPCEHYGEWDYDADEVCDEPCGQRHEWCRACGRPMKPPCPIVEDIVAAIGEQTI
jgi:hypothetical protein